MPEMRAGDSDRELVVEILRDQHLAGRLDGDDLEQRLERCLAAISHAELHAITADLPIPRVGGPASRGRTGRGARGSMRRVLRKLAGLVAILLLAIWALTDDGYFWPAWALFGLGLPLGLDASLHWALRRFNGVKRRARVLWTLFGFLEGGFVVVWALTAISGSGAYFWPVWPLLGFIAIAGSYSALAPAARH